MIKKRSYLMKKVFTLIVLVAAAVLAQAQETKKGTGKISGTVMDNGTNKPVEFATIALTDANGKTIDGTIADVKGRGNFHVLTAATVGVCHKIA